MTHWIEEEHPDYRSRCSVLRTYRDLYVGGEQLRANASNYLARRQKEPYDVYQERLSRVYYENYAGSIIDWYTATLFRREPLVTVEGEDSRGRKFLGAFQEDCDLGGASFPEFFRGRLQEALVCGSSHILIDFPRTKNLPETLAEEDRCGVSRAYLVDCAPEQLTNWSMNEHGEYDWVVVRTSTQRKSSPAQKEWSKETRWIYYDRERFQVYGRLDESEGEALLVDEGVHGLAGRGLVPIVTLAVPEGLWLMNKGGLLQLEHFNKSNALAWALTVGLFAMPVVYSEREWKQIIGESYFIQLGPQDRFGWTEPEGHVYQIAAENLSRLKDEIYRVCYLLSQAGGPVTSGRSQSGLSKQRDFQTTQEVLRAYGDMVKETMKRVLRMVTEARGDAVTVDVSGLDEFDIGDFSGELADAERLLSLGIPSLTLKRQVFKKLAFKFLCDSRQETKDRIAAEIDKGLEDKQ